MTESEIEFSSVNYLEDPLSADDLKQVLRSAGLSPHEAIRTSEPNYRQLVAGKNLTVDELLQVMAAHPELLQRPIVVHEGKAVLARPVANLAKIGIK